MLTCIHNNYLYMGDVSYACKYCADLMCCITQLAVKGEPPM